MDDTKECSTCTDNCDIANWLYAIYIILSILWIIIVVYFGYFKLQGFMFLFIPLITFAISAYNIPKMSVELEDSIFRPTNLSLGLIIAIPLFTWLSQHYEGDKKMFASIIIVALLLSLVTLIDLWVQRCWLTVYKHIRSAFQTMSITLFMFALVNYYLMRNCDGIAKQSK